jgi:hypothetical protein
MPIEEFLLTRLAFTPDGHHIVIGHKSLTLYDILSGKDVRTFPFEAFLGSVCFSKDGKYLGCVNESDNHPQTRGLAKVFEVATGEVVFEAHPAFPVQAACFLDADGVTLFVYRDTAAELPGDVSTRRDRLRACRIPSGELTAELDFPNWTIRGIAGSAHNLAVLGQSALPKPYAVEGASMEYYPFQVAHFAFPEGGASVIRNVGMGIGAFAFSRGGAGVALETVDFRANTRQVSLLDIASGTDTPLAKLGLDIMPAFAFSAEGRLLVLLAEEAQAGGNVLRIWDTSDLSFIGSTPLDAQYHAIAANWPTCRIAAIGGGKCDIGLIHP